MTDASQHGSVRSSADHTSLARADDIVHHQLGKLFGREAVLGLGLAVGPAGDDVLDRDVARGRGYVKACRIVDVEIAVDDPGQESDDAHTERRELQP